MKDVTPVWRTARLSRFYLMYEHKAGGGYGTSTGSGSLAESGQFSGTLRTESQVTGSPRRRKSAAPTVYAITQREKSEISEEEYMDRVNEENGNSSSNSESAIETLAVAPGHEIMLRQSAQ